MTAPHVGELEVVLRTPCDEFERRDTEITTVSLSRVERQIARWETWKAPTGRMVRTYIGNETESKAVVELS